MNKSCDGKAPVKLEPCTRAVGLQRPGALATAAADLAQEQIDPAFGEAVNQQVARLFGFPAWRQNWPKSSVDFEGIREICLTVDGCRPGTSDDHVAHRDR